MELLDITGYEAIPEELQQYPNWITYKIETLFDKNGKPKLDGNGKLKQTKKPYTPTTGMLADTTNPATWVDFDTAIACESNYDGLGFVFTNSPFVGVDLDNVSDEIKAFEKGDTNNIVGEFHEALQTYMEISPSGNGVHLIVKGELPAGKRKIGDVEMYDTNRYFTVTGDQLGEFDEVNSNGTDLLKPLHKKYLGVDNSIQVDFKDWEAIPSYGNGLDAEEVLQALKKSKDGEKWIDLVTNGDWHKYAYPSRSDAELAVVGKLGFFSDYDKFVIDEICQSSILIDEKWNRSSSPTKVYTLAKVIANRPENGGYKAKSDFNLKIKDKPEPLDKVIPGKTHLSKLEHILRSKRDDTLRYLRKEAEKAGRKPPTSISPLSTADELNRNIIFTLFDTSEDSKIAMYIPEDGVYTQNYDLIRRIISWYEPVHDRNRASTVIYHLKNMAKVREKTVSRFLIPVLNGVFNLKTKTLEEFTPEYVFTSKIQTPYVHNPKPIDIDGWNVDEWIKGLANDEEDTEILLWQVISASMNGNYSRKKSIWLYSDGSTGKGTYQQLIINLVGVKNVATLKLPQFSERFALSMLEEKVVCIGDEVPSNVHIDDSSNFNSVITGDYVSVEQKNQPLYSTSFNLTIIQSTNGLPKIRNKSEGTYRRFLIIEFKNQYLGKNDNENIKWDYIKRPEVLEYVLHKAINMDFEKFIDPEASQQLLEAYRIDNDPVVEFKIEIFDHYTSTRLPVQYVFKHYCDFCEQSGYKPLGKNNFTKSLERIIGKDWTKENKRPSGYFKETHWPYGTNKNDFMGSAMCFINSRVEVA